MTFTSVLSIFAAVFLVFACTFAVPQMIARFLDWIERVYNRFPKY
jgi:hypothetical protein